MSDVQEIITRLARDMRNASMFCEGPAVPWMTARDIAVAAVHAAADARTRETLALLDAELAGVLADALHSDGPPLAADDAAAFLAPYVRALVARRFPNGKQLWQPSHSLLAAVSDEPKETT